jgi:molybdopterin converting factor small subunit
MNIQVRLFPPLDQQVGVETLALILPDPADGAALLDRLRTQVGDRLPEPERLMLVVNNQYATPETLLQDGDQVWIIHRRSCCH